MNTINNLLINKQIEELINTYFYTTKEILTIIIIDFIGYHNDNEVINYKIIMNGYNNLINQYVQNTLTIFPTAINNSIVNYINNDNVLFGKLKKYYNSINNSLNNSLNNSINNSINKTEEHQLIKFSELNDCYNSSENLFKQTLIQIKNNINKFYLIGPNYQKVININNKYIKSYAFNYIMLCINYDDELCAFSSYNSLSYNKIKYNELLNIDSNIDFKENTYYSVSVPRSNSKLIICVMKEGINIENIKFENDYDAYCIRMDYKIICKPINCITKIINNNINKQYLISIPGLLEDVYCGKTPTTINNSLMFIKEFYKHIFSNILNNNNNFSNNKDKLTNNNELQMIDIVVQKINESSITIRSNYIDKKNNKHTIFTNDYFVKYKNNENASSFTYNQFYMAVNKSNDKKVNYFININDLIKMLNNLISEHDNVSNILKMILNIKERSINLIYKDIYMIPDIKDIQSLNLLEESLTNKNMLDIEFDCYIISNLYYNILYMYLKKVLFGIHNKITELDYLTNTYSELGYKIIENNKSLKIDHKYKQIIFTD